MIYEKNLWGGRFSRGFHSGSGSRDYEIISPYIGAVRDLLIRLGKPSVVDVGCGDFFVGRQLVGYASPMIACDIVRQLIEDNQRRHPGVDFTVVDAIEDELPNADVVLV